MSDKQPSCPTRCVHQFQSVRRCQPAKRCCPPIEGDGQACWWTCFWRRALSASPMGASSGLSRNAWCHQRVCWLNRLNAFFSPLRSYVCVTFVNGYTSSNWCHPILVNHLVPVKDNTFAFFKCILILVNR